MRRNCSCREKFGVLSVVRVFGRTFWWHVLRRETHQTTLTRPNRKAKQCEREVDEGFVDWRTAAHGKRVLPNIPSSSAPLVAHRPRESTPPQTVGENPPEKVSMLR